MEPSKPTGKTSKKAMDKVRHHFVSPFQYAQILILSLSRCYRPPARIEKQPRKVNLYHDLLVLALDPVGFPLTCCAASR
jgi:hypothetical protein